jgi:hypothetical protein
MVIPAKAAPYFDTGQKEAKNWIPHHPPEAERNNTDWNKYNHCIQD